MKLICLTWIHYMKFAFNCKYRETRLLYLT